MKTRVALATMAAVVSAALAPVGAATAAAPSPLPAPIAYTEHPTANQQMRIGGDLTGKNPATRPAVLQVKRGDSWRTVARTTARRTSYMFVADAPSFTGKASLRVVLPRKATRTAVYPRRVTRSRSVLLQPDLFPAKTMSSNTWRRQVNDVATDAQGNVYLACTCGKWGGYMNLSRKSVHPQIIRIDKNGRRTVIAGNGRPGRPVAGRATASPLQEMQSIAVDSRGNVFASMEHTAKGSGRPFVVRVSPAGDLSIVAGNGTYGPVQPGPGRKSPMREIAGLGVGSDDTLYIAMDPGFGVPSVVTRVRAGSDDIEIQTKVPCEDGFSTEDSFTVDSSGHFLWAGRCDGHQLERIGPDGSRAVLAGSSTRWRTVKPGAARTSPLPQQAMSGFTVDPGGNIYLLSNSPSVIRITPGGQLTDSIVDGPDWIENTYWGALASSPTGRLVFLGDLRIRAGTPRQ